MSKEKAFATWWNCICYHKEQLDDMLNSPDIKGYAWILHDKDFLDSDDKSKGLKKPHYHCLVRFGRNQRYSWFARFWTDDLGEINREPTHDPHQSFDYLTHNTQKAMSEGKHRYDPSEVHSTLTELEFVEQDEGKKINGTELYKLIFEKGFTPSELVLEYELTLQQINLAERVYYERQKQLFEELYRANLELYYLYGDTRTGKTRFVTDKHGYKNIYRAQGYEYGKWFDGYEGQDVLLLDEYFDGFNFDMLLQYTDKHPFVIQCRFRNKQACFTKIYMTSNVPLSAQYKNIQVTRPKSWEAFTGRFTGIYRFDENGKYHSEPLPSKKKTPDQLQPLDEDETKKLEQLGF